MKNYCECYQAGKGCIDTCRCVDCENEHGVKPPKSKRKKFDPFGTHFTHRSSLPQPTFVKQESDLVKQEPQADLELDKHLNKHSPDAHKILPRTPEKSLPALPSSSDPKAQVFSKFISSQLEAVTQQRAMYESMLKKHIERLQRKEQVLTDVLQRSSEVLSEDHSASSKAEVSDKEREFQLELRRLFEEFQETELEVERTIERKYSNGSAPSSPGSSTATMSEGDSCTSDSECDEEAELQLSGRKWPDAEDTADNKPLSASLIQRKSELSIAPPAQPFDNLLTKPAPPFGSLERVTSDFALPNLPSINLPIQEMTLPTTTIDRFTSSDLYPGLICRNLSGDAASSVGNWCNMIMT